MMRQFFGRTSQSLLHQSSSSSNNSCSTTPCKGFHKWLERKSTAQSSLQENSHSQIAAKFQPFHSMSTATGKRNFHQSQQTPVQQQRHATTSQTLKEKVEAKEVEDFFAYKSVGSHPLDKLFKPQTVAVIGASEKEGSVGRTILWNLISSPFGGTIFPVNPKRKNVMGILAYSSIKEIPQKVDMAVICIPAPQVPKAIQECVDAGIEAACVISAGFSEAGEEGKKWAEEMLAIAKKGKMRIFGPNCLGIMNPLIGFNCTFATTIALPGKIALISQSGALATSILDWSLQEKVGFSSFLSIGSMIDIQWADLLEYLGRDPNTESIIIYMESIGDARAFVSAARRVALTKPIVLIKVGRTEAGAAAAASHTGTMTGSDHVLDAVFTRSGVLRVDTIAELFYMAQVLAKQPRPKGEKLSIITNAGGPSALATDALVRYGGKLSPISPENYKELDEYLPTHWSHGNPIDVLGDAPPERYAKTLEIVSKDSNSDGILVILTPQAMSDPTQTAEVLRNYARNFDKPILASWMGGSTVETGKRILSQSGIPVFEFPDQAAKVFNYMHQYSKNLETLYEIPNMESFTQEVPEENREKARQLLHRVRSTGRTLLTEFESKELLSLYLIPTTANVIAATEEEAVKVAQQIGYPIVLKLHSETITHKSDVGGVRLNIKEEKYLRQAFRDIKSAVEEKDFMGVSVQPFIKLKDSYEIIFGSTTDAQCGPVILFGTGGTNVEVYKDSTLALPPLTNTLANRMIESTKIYKALKGYRGKSPVNLKLLSDLLVRFSLLVTDLSLHVKEIDINPLVCSAEKIIALDARVLVYPQDQPLNKIPKPALRPYPFDYVTHMPHFNIDDQTDVNLRIRPSRADDQRPLLEFYKSISKGILMKYAEQEEALKYVKVFNNLQVWDEAQQSEGKKLKLFREGKEMIDVVTRMSMGDYDKEIVLLAENYNTREIYAVSTYSRAPNAKERAYLSVIVKESVQSRLLGESCVKCLVDIAKKEGNIQYLIAQISKNNFEMQRLTKRLGFELDQKPNGSFEAVYKFY